MEERTERMFTLQVNMTQIRFFSCCLNVTNKIKNKIWPRSERGSADSVDCDDVYPYVMTYSFIWGLIWLYDAVTCSKSNSTIERPYETNDWSRSGSLDHHMLTKWQRKTLKISWSWFVSSLSVVNDCQLVPHQILAKDFQISLRFSHSLCRLKLISFGSHLEVSCKATTDDF